MADDKLEIQLTVDNRLAKQALDDTGSAATKLSRSLTSELASSGSSSLGLIAEVINTRVLVALGAAGVAIGAIKIALDFTLEAEKIQQISNSFNALARSSGLAGDQIKEGLNAAARGLADDDDILQAASRGIVQLGDKASALPQIMDLARKATALFGGDLIQNFENLNAALASGNARALRQFGIFLDGDQAVKKYAASLGVSASVLSDAGQKNAVFTAGLEAASKKLADVDETAVGATNELQRLKVALGEFKETIAVTVEKSGLFQLALQHIREEIELYGGALKDHFGTPLEQATAKANTAQATIKALEADLKSLRKELENSAGFDRASILSEIAQDQVKLNQAKAEYLSLQTKVQAVAPKEASGKYAQLSSQNAGPTPDKNINQDALNALKDSYAQTVLAIKASRLQIYQELLQIGETAGNADVQVQDLNTKRIALINEQFDDQEKALKQRNAKDRILSEQALANTLVDLNQERADKINAILQQEVDQRIALRTKEIENDPAASYGNVVQSFRDQSEQIKNIASSMAASVRNSFAGGFTSAFAAMGNAFATGKNGLQEFGKTVLGTIGALCIQLGTFFVLVGAGMTATATILGVSGGAAIAAGIALSVLGGVLQGLAGGGSSAASSGGGVASSSADETSSSTSAPDTATGRTTSVVVNVEGNILDKRETGMYITDALNEYFSSSDGKLLVAS